MVGILHTAVQACPAARALCQMPRLRLLAISEPARQKRPTIDDWIGRDLIGIATNVLQEMLDDRPLQRAIARREVVSVVSTTRSVLDTPEAPSIKTFRTTSTYFFHEGALYSDAFSVPVSADEPCGYTPIYIDEMGHDLFGDREVLEAALASQAIASPGTAGTVKHRRHGR